MSKPRESRQYFYTTTYIKEIQYVVKLCKNIGFTEHLEPDRCDKPRYMVIEVDFISKDYRIYKFMAYPICRMTSLLELTMRLEKVADEKAV